MAIIHRASITPTKLELVAIWLERAGGVPGEGELRQVGSYRFDDPEGEVGIEALLVTRGGPVVQVAMTYRGAPLPGAETHLIGTMEHSVLGRRWVHEANGDRVALAAYQRALSGAQAQAALEIWEGDTLVETRPQTVVLEVRHPASSPSAIRARVASGIGPEPADAPGAPALLARWDGGETVVAVGEPV
ncbi:hypothetical protein ncot_04520 [Nocardioides sp. JQ2195]|uniref:maltokinase N-terminal cap-like domain-containing protein n=1 Tax=Nocardioides sp. JQ2195 TaxID=2592334 RepID=UPI00143E5D3D|nr:hypothetical protein [Nocardioides sp. JQ2195]QIX25945.1 hypothetical protein ncot_04520 [Nocardioides sp. JQ2195]